MKKYSVILICLLCLIFGVSCSKKEDTAEKNQEQMKSYQTVGDLEISEKEQEKISEGLLKAAEVYSEQFKDTELLDETGISAVVSVLGENGYCAIDEENQLNMVNADQLESFLSSLKAEKNEEAVVYLVGDSGELVRLDFYARGGSLVYIRTVAKWNERKKPEITYMGGFEAKSWKYTDRGYLFFEKKQAAGYDGETPYSMIRVSQISEENRQAAATYIENIGYLNQNLFTSDWTEADFSGLDLMDLYEYLYADLYGKHFDADAYQDGIPKEEFEAVFQHYFQISSEKIQELVPFDAEKQKYQWEEREGADYTSARSLDPEVTEIKDNGDGTLTLSVAVVWAEKETDQAFVHKLTVRPLSDGSYQYVSNEVEDSEDNLIPESPGN